MHFRVLGPLEVTGEDGDPLRIAGAKERTVLASLIAHAGRVVSADELIRELWGDHPPRTAERTLGSYVSRLRHALRAEGALDATAEPIRSHGGGYLLDRNGHDIDAIRFEESAGEARRFLEAGRPHEAVPLLSVALDLWRGNAYQEFRSTAFGQSEGERLEELRRVAAEDRIDARLEIGEAAELVPELESMVNEGPLRERRWGQLMLALYRSGRQAEALQAFTRARAVLVEDLGIEPGPVLQRLQAAILAHDADLERTRPVRTEPVRTTDVCPYKGLARFETDDAGFFFGREALVAEAVGHVVQARFLALVGPSGSGKSSVMRAGLLHALATGAIPGSERWTQVLVRPGEHPLDAWMGAIRRDGQPTVIAIDQFEEVFTTCTDEDERTAFLDELTAAVRDPASTTSVVIAIRADLYGRCATHRGLASLVASEQILVGPMDGDELRRAIEAPAERAGLVIEPELTKSLVADTLGQPGGLPLLSTALLELWTRRRDRTLRHDEYLRTGGVEGAVARLAEDAFGRLDEDDRTAAKRLLLRLAAQDEHGQVVRRRAPLAEFDLDRDAGASRALDVLTHGRLVTVAEGTAEVAHEALLGEWPRLRGWLEDDAEGRTLHRHLTESTRAWDEGGRDPADLYRGARLTAALDWAEPNASVLNELERGFLRASRDASEGEAVETRRTNRRLRGLLAGVAFLLVISLVIGNLALRQRDQARDTLALADAGRLASRSLVEEDPVRALLLAREAVHIHDSAETRSALFSALQRSQAITRRSYAAGGPASVGEETQWIAIAPDGGTLAIGDTGRTIAFFDAASGEPVGDVDIGSGTERAAFSPEGGTLAIVTSTDEIVAVDVATRSERVRVSAGGTVDAIAFSPDGTDLVTAEASDTREYLVRRDPMTLEPTLPRVPTPNRPTDPAVDPEDFPIPPLSSYSIAFTADGRSVVTTRPTGPTVLWNDDLTPVGRFPIAGDGVALAPDRSVAALIRNDHRTLEGSLLLLDLQSGDVRVAAGAHSGPSRSRFEAVGLAFTPDGRSVVSVGNDSRLVVWDVASASVREALTGAGDLPLRGPAISPDGTTAFTTDRDRDVVVWDLSGEARLGRPFIAGTGISEWPWFALSPDGRTIAVPSTSADREFGRSGGVEVIDTATLEVIRHIPYPNGTPQGMAFGPDPRVLAVSSWSSARGRSDVRLWDVGSGTPITPDLPGIADGVQVYLPEFSPDGRTLAGGGGCCDREGLVYMWSVRTSPELVDRIETRRPVNDLTYTPDGSLLVAPTGWLDGGDVVIWDADTLSEVRTIAADEAAALIIDVSNDGHTLVTGGQTSIVRMWDVATGSSVGPSLSGLTGWADTVDLSPDDRTVLGADSAGTVLLWDVATGTVIGDPFPGPGPDEFLAASFTPDGKSAIVISDSGSGWSWDVDPSSWKARACRIAGRNLTTAEWQEFLPDRPYHATCDL